MGQPQTLPLEVDLAIMINTGEGKLMELCLTSEMQKNRAVNPINSFGHMVRAKVFGVGDDLQKVQGFDGQGSILATG